jgi:AcrR family transcriptional regulator
MSNRPNAASVRRLQARDRVIAVSVDLFLKQGFDQTTIREIVAASGISMRTFFRYFPSKEDLAFPRADEGTEKLRALLARNRNPQHPLLGVRDALVELGNWYEELREDLLKEWQYESRSAALIARGAEIESRNQQAIADALADAGVPHREARYLASVVFGGIRANLEQWFEDECRQDLLVVAANTLVLLEGMDALFFAEGRFQAPDGRSAPLAIASSVLKGIVNRVGDRFLGKTP